ncbi:hypothetical protein B0H19DRAFT_1090531 [Mycena capillaripes]|nr:hypothetical protein B0H19DRAFT_1090531 [Mycena capillaripes]
MKQKTIFGEFQRPDGTTCVLPSLDLAVCAMGHERLLQAQWKPENRLGWIVSWKFGGNCTDHAKCQQVREALINRILLSLEVFAFHLLPIHKRFCAACAKSASAATEAGCAKMWEALPFFFDLPTSSELKSSNEL